MNRQLFGNPPPVRRVTVRRREPSAWAALAQIAVVAGAVWALIVLASAFGGRAY